jgi:hypothetical protein
VERRNERSQRAFIAAGFSEQAGIEVAGYRAFLMATRRFRARWLMDR